MRRPRSPFLRAQAAKDPKPHANQGINPAQVRRAGAGGDWVLGESNLLVGSPNTTAGVTWSSVPSPNVTSSFTAMNLVGAK